MEQILVFIHGNSSDGESFGHVIPEFERAGFTCRIVELAGHGKAQRLPAYSLAELSRVLVEDLQGLAPESYFLIGHSLGGHMILQSLPQLSPAGVMVIGTPALSNPPPADAFQAVAEMGYYMQANVSDDELLRLATLTTASPALSASFIAKFRNTDSHVRSGILDSLASGTYPDELRILATTDIPVKLISCRQDQFVNAAYLERIISTIDNALVTLDQWDADHNPQWHAPELFVNEVVRFAHTHSQLSSYNPQPLSQDNHRV